MAADPEALVRLLDGTAAHVAALDALDGLSEEDAVARREGWPYSCHEILLHAVYWQDLFLARFAGDPAPIPSTAAQGWPEAGLNRWSDTVHRFTRGLESAKERARTDDLDATLSDWQGIRRGEGLAIIAQHNSYHLGQIVALRRVLGAWPPPGGGDTW